MSERKATDGRLADRSNDETPRMRFLVTGANGFIGRTLCREALNRSFAILPVCRNPDDSPLGEQSVVVCDINASTDWRSALSACEGVVHLAARVHVMRDSASDLLDEFRRVNVAGTLNLAQQAADAGVQRFVFVSSIKVNGEETVPGRAFTEKDLPAPQDAYAVSKWEAEQGLLKLAEETSMEVVIIRPPLVYGPGVKANFLTMLRLVARGIPLPFALVNNRRSFLAVENLVDFILLCLEHPAAANKVFLVADGEDLSTPELLRNLGTAVCVRAKNFPIPVSFLRAGAVLVGRRDLFQRLCSSLQIDITMARNFLGWNPPVRAEEALLKTGQHFRAHQLK